MIHQIKVGMIIQVVYYENKQYVQIEGIVSKINLVAKFYKLLKLKLIYLTLLTLK